MKAFQLQKIHCFACGKMFIVKWCDKCRFRDRSLCESCHNHTKFHREIATEFYF